MSLQQFDCFQVSWDVGLWTPSISLLVRKLGWQESSIAQQSKLGHVAVRWGELSDTKPAAKIFQIWSRLKFCPLFLQLVFRNKALWGVVQCFTFLFTSVAINGTEDSYSVLRTDDVAVCGFPPEKSTTWTPTLWRNDFLYGCQKFRILLAKVVKCCTCLLSCKTQCYSGPNVKMVECWVWKSFFMPLMQKAFYSQN